MIVVATQNGDLGRVAGGSGKRIVKIDNAYAIWLEINSVGATDVYGVTEWHAVSSLFPTVDTC